MLLTCRAQSTSPTGPFVIPGRRFMKVYSLQTVIGACLCAAVLGWCAHGLRDELKAIWRSYRG